MYMPFLGGKQWCICSSWVCIRVHSLPGCVYGVHSLPGCVRRYMPSLGVYGGIFPPRVYAGLGTPPGVCGARYPPGVLLLVYTPGIHPPGIHTLPGTHCTPPDPPEVYPPPAEGQLTALRRAVAERTVTDAGVTEARVYHHPFHCWSMFSSC